MNTQEKIKKLEAEILKNRRLYYGGEAVLSDHDYDALEEKLREIDPDNALFFVVGSHVREGSKVPHKTKMLSLQKTYDVKELLKWMGEREVLSMEKIDGSSCSLIYKSGELVLAKTRGDGLFGENITEKALCLDDIPKSLSSKVDCEVRGEVYCTEDGFHQLSLEMERRKLEKPNSLRNIVAGILGRKENIDLSGYLSFKAFEIMGNFSFQTEVEKFLLIGELGFIAPKVTLHRGEKKIPHTLKKAQDFMGEGTYLIDGIVFSYNNLNLHRELGETAHHPRYKMAFKFAGESRETLLEKITWQVSRNGILTPVAEIETVEVSGANVSRVSLHNWGLVRDFQLTPGDIIEIERSGEVIPKFIRIVKKSKNIFSVPKVCPSCSTVLLEDDIRLKCLNDHCPEKNLEETKYFIKAIGIDDLSTERIRELYEKKLISKVSDIFSLTRESLMKNLSGYKDKLAEKVISNIQARKEIPLLDFLVALGLRGGGRTKCEKLLVEGQVFTLEDVLELSLEEISSIEGFAEKSATEFLHSLNEKKIFIREIRKQGVKILSREEREKKSETFLGKTFCITGKLSRPRKEIEDWIKNKGGKVSGSVSSRTDYLICNEEKSSSSKFKKSKELSIPIISEETLWTGEL